MRKGITEPGKEKERLHDADRLISGRVETCRTLFDKLPRSWCCTWDLHVVSAKASAEKMRIESKEELVPPPSQRQRVGLIGIKRR